MNILAEPKSSKETPTARQMQAVASTHNKILLIAGPGSGKTKTLINRLDFLLAQGDALAHSVACITFTNEAAHEIERRLANIDPAVEPRKIKLGYCGTLHGFILRLMKEHGKLIGFKGKIAMLDENQSEKLLAQVIKDTKVKLPMKEIRAALAKGPEKFLSNGRAALKAAAAKPADRGFDDLIATFKNEELIAFEYFQRLLGASLLDFDSLLQFGAILLRKMRDADIKLPFSHVFWDESQDSGREDMAILEALTIPFKFVVGDPDQSIYGFRGGSPEHILKLADGQGWQVITLEDNFRCDECIAGAANALIGHNKNRLAKLTLSKTGRTGKVFTFRKSSESDELREIAADIQTGAFEPKGCAVLVRSNALADRFSKGLEAFGIPITRKEKVSKPEDWGLARALINLLTNPDNDLLAYSFIEQTKDTKFANNVKLQALQKFTSINRHFLNLPYDMALDQVPQALAKSGVKAESLALINKAAQTLPAGAGLAELSYALGDDELHRKEVGEGVTVTTMHSSKGREWDCVYLPAFEDGVIPIQSANANEEEERRLAFVAITRARQRLVVSFAEFRKPQFGGYKPEPTAISRFVAEIRSRE